MLWFSQTLTKFVIIGMKIFREGSTMILSYPTWRAMTSNMPYFPKWYMTWNITFSMMLKDIHSHGFLLKAEGIQHILLTKLPRNRPLPVLLISLLNIRRFGSAFKCHFGQYCSIVFPFLYLASRSLMTQLHWASCYYLPEYILNGPRTHSLW